MFFRRNQQHVCTESVYGGVHNSNQVLRMMIKYNNQKIMDIQRDMYDVEV